MRYTEPTIITTLEQVEWTKTYPDYPASEWQLNYYFRGPGVGFNAAWGVEVVADGDDFVITVLGNKTDDVTVAGKYTWQAWLTEAADTANKIMVGSGFVNIRLGFDSASTATVETRSQAKIMLDTIEAALLAFATSDVLEYEIATPAGTRKVKRSDKTQLMSLQKHYATLVANERARERSRNGGPIMQSIKIEVFEQ